MIHQIKNILAQKGKDHELAPPALKSDILALVSNIGFELPSEYLAFLSLHDGGNGQLPVQPYWYELWPASEVIQNNENYEVAKYLLGFLAIGSNQGGELLYISYTPETKGNIVAIPLIPSEPSYANLVAKSFKELIPLLGIEHTPS